MIVMIALALLGAALWINNDLSRQIQTIQGQFDYDELKIERLLLVNRMMAEYIDYNGVCPELFAIYAERGLVSRTTVYKTPDEKVTSLAKMRDDAMEVLKIADPSHYWLVQSPIDNSNLSMSSNCDTWKLYKDGVLITAFRMRHFNVSRILMLASSK